MSDVLKAYLRHQSPASVSVSVEEFALALDQLDEVQEERQEVMVAIEEMSDAHEEIFAHIEVADNYVATLSAGMEKGRFSQEHLYHARLALNNLNELMGGDTTQIGLEDFAEDDLHAQYQVSVEGFMDVIKKLGAAIDASIEKVREGFALFGTNDKAADALKKKLAATKEKHTFEGDSATFPLGKLARVFNHQGAVVSDIIPSINRDKGAMKYLAEKHLNIMADYHLDVLAVALSIGQGRAKTDAFDTFLKKTSPNDQAPQGLRNGTDILGGAVRSQPITINGDVYNDIKQFTKKMKHEKRLFDKPNKKAAGEVKITAKDAAQLLTFANDYIELMLANNREAKRQLYRMVTANRAAVNKAKQFGITQSVGVVHTGQGVTPVITTTVDNGPKATLVRGMAENASRTATATLKHFSEISSVLEDKAETCLALYVKSCNA